MSSRTAGNFPSHLIDPIKKDYNWILNYTKAAWNEYGSIRTIFYHRAWDYRKIKDYALGNQSINQYKEILNVDDDKNTTWLNIDWRVLPIITKFRRIALNKLKKIQYDVDAVAVDSLAIDEKEAYVAEQKAKLALKAELEKTNPELAQKITEPNDAMDLDELKIKELYTYKHNATIEMETALELIFGQNKLDIQRDKIMTDLFDYGVSGYKDWIDSNGSVKFRRVNPEALVVNYCTENDFSDKQYAGEVIRMTIADLKQAAGNKFTEEEYQQIAGLVKGKYGNPTYVPNPTVYSQGYDDFHIDVLDLEFYSVNEMVHESRVNKRGNAIFGRTDYNKRQDSDNKTYKRTAYKVVYETSWIIGTNYMFNHGLATNMKRSKNDITDCDMSFHLYAPEFFDMQAKGITEQLIPIANAIQIAWYKLQNAINQARPKGIEINLDAIEDVPLGDGGKSLEPYEVIDMFNETGTLAYRRRDMGGNDSNWRPIQEIENGLGKDVITYYDIIQRNIQMIRDITGLNEMVDGSTPDPRTLTTVANMANEASNNALGDVVVGDQQLLKDLSGSLYIRLQDAVKFGNIEGYTKSLGSDSVKFIRVSSNISAHVFGIFVRLALSDDERAQFKMELKEMANAGMIEPDTAVIIGNIANKAQAEQVLAFMVKRTRDQKAKQAQADMEMNGKIQQQSAQVAEQAKQATEQLKNKGEVEKENAKGQWALKAIDLKGQWDMRLSGANTEGKIKETAASTMGKMAEQEEASTKNAGNKPSQ